MVSTETPKSNIVQIIKDRLTAGTATLSDVVAQRVSAVRGYFDQLFADKATLKEICMPKTDGTLVCVDGDQLDTILQYQKTSTPPPTTPPAPDPTPQPNPTTPAPDPTPLPPEPTPEPTPEPVTP
jgi:cell division septation protein DedD